jgi:small subunit ribosomal protein S17|tara:strand:+ start:578 stop:910 length:333 start_codon:yes stop_codon:yes gene_type:complete
MTSRNIGLKVKSPKGEPDKNDLKNPFNGTLSIRGKLFEGKVVKNKAKNTVVIQKESPVYFSKYKRYARSKNTIHAHVPSNLEIKENDIVIAAECRPLAKSVSFVVVGVKE